MVLELYLNLDELLSSESELMSFCLSKVVSNSKENKSLASIAIFVERLRDSQCLCKGCSGSGTNM